MLLLATPWAWRMHADYQRRALRGERRLARIVVFGHSEGGIAVASSEPPTGVRGVIVSGWTCHATVPIGTGLLAPPSVAVLAIEFERDTIVSRQGRCSDFFQGRTAGN